MLQRLDQLTDQAIGIVNHRFVFFFFVDHVRIGGGRDQRAMGQSHREIKAHRLVTMTFHEIDEITRVNVGAKFTLIRLASFWRVNVRIPVSLITGRIARFVTCPHAPVIKSMLFHRARFNPEIIDLPFADRARGVTTGFHDAGEGDVFPPVEIAHTPTRHVPMVDPTRPPRILARQ